MAVKFMLDTQLITMSRRTKYGQAPLLAGHFMDKPAPFTTFCVFLLKTDI
jgi:hypothetical protein